MINFKTHTTGRYFKRAAIVGISVFLAFGTLTDPSSSKSRLWHSLLFLLPFLRPGAKEACVPMPDGSAKVMPDGSAKVRAHAGRISSGACPCRTDQRSRVFVRFCRTDLPTCIMQHLRAPYTTCTHPTVPCPLFCVHSPTSGRRYFILPQTLHLSSFFL